jgi:hypothetical protein
MCDDQTDKRTNGQQKSYIPQSFFGGGMQILSKINFRNLKKIYISCKSTWVYRTSAVRSFVCPSGRHNFFVSPTHF